MTRVIIVHEAGVSSLNHLKAVDDGIGMGVPHSADILQYGRDEYYIIIIHFILI